MDEPVLSSAEEPPRPVVMRRCRTCSVEKPESEYYVKSKKTNLLMLDCKSCICADRRAYIQAHPERRSYLKPEIRERRYADFRRRYHEDPEKYRKIGREAYQRNKVRARATARKRYYENQEQEIQRSLKWNRENPDKVKAWVDANRDKVNASTKRHREKHPEVHKQCRARRRATQMGVRTERLKAGYYDRLFAWQKGRCPYCNVDLLTVKVHEDHVISLKRGGEHSERNLQLTCKPCNLRKSSKDPMAFAAEMGVVKDPTLIPI